MELDRLLQSQGFGSRKMCRKLIQTGAFAIDGVVHDDPRESVDPLGLQFTLDGEPWEYREHVYVLLNKPEGFECSTSPTHHEGVHSLLPLPLAVRGVQPAGRLDQDTTGMLLLSDDGPFLHAMMSPRRHIPKRYVATTKHPVTEAMLQALRDGVLLRDETEPLAATDVMSPSPHEIALTITQGKYHQVKRMVAAAGNRVEGLVRIAIGGLPMGNLALGEWRYLSPDELLSLPYEAPASRK
ncbi:pseudouridine synthase [Pandoraea apista]|uniref:Ribosomal small subunit pseudouridine synthase A n=2 Tax=Pandoraea apista TaxID=93218 RepID=A0ABX9ZHY7_9BURK|nr:16S rRNA pseudouridine(516) synthase [Pandoraea apista]AJE99665.1 pseudouridine synthase [Pandoraea apista]AKH73791.1 pseudouridine synthase [Pandoraea apista]AKI62339.1 pseudouridine synthase [Pandoraea apista]ALS64058.1 16S rRNA pseudouridine(516) synthase [Pandoraea apista]PTE03123.1 16S rRNA pseudouridine(516) synthase [Pandoraea apista]